MVDQFGSVDMDEFYGTWRMAFGEKARSKKLERLSGFFRVLRKWIGEKRQPTLGCTTDDHPRLPGKGYADSHNLPLGGT
jgi:hypothetical protein